MAKVGKKEFQQVRHLGIKGPHILVTQLKYNFIPWLMTVLNSGMEIYEHKLQANMTGNVILQ